MFCCVVFCCVVLVKADDRGMDKREPQQQRRMSRAWDWAFYGSFTSGVQDRSGLWWFWLRTSLLKRVGISWHRSDSSVSPFSFPLRVKFEIPTMNVKLDLRVGASCE